MTYDVQILRVLVTLCQNSHFYINVLKSNECKSSTNKINTKFYYYLQSNRLLMYIYIILDKYEYKHILQSNEMMSPGTFNIHICYMIYSFDLFWKNVAKIYFTIIYDVIINTIIIYILCEFTTKLMKVSSTWLIFFSWIFFWSSVTLMLPRIARTKWFTQTHPTPNKSLMKLMDKDDGSFSTKNTRFSWY